MKLLALSDVELNFIYNPTVVDRFHDCDLVIGCGDLPFYYLEYVVSMLNRRTYYVHGNHAYKSETTESGDKMGPWGAINLHMRCVRDESGLLLAGIEGSVCYNNGPYQYTQKEMWFKVCQLVPWLQLNRVRYGRYLDVLITHAPPWKIHDDEDLPHHGIRAFRWLIERFKPALHLHGHIHIYSPAVEVETLHAGTRVINTYGYRVIELDNPS
jgi:Icc-related predicted phosphoesterase